ncbi:enoyl-CoA hydratase-related protein [Paenibacillus sp. BSR1-1]|uniref:enoyl-CoA hydratase/isomerase family protein n=1 Tax=Paenibacillus sp. BSR1-1 TaxID=3020845 RepID=UPI0025B246EA|nr:enoyl-CoA hydratase-related protein [Paenibacillus sp. BSR1-1]MDN3020099.1 enoyl-CoA hydratase-related protein [Paenibacillus sp. BSR1-1]
MEKDLVFKVENGIATIILDRPENYNAFSVDMIKNWIKALETIRDDDQINVAVVTGRGKAFCAGGDLKALKDKKGFFMETNSEGDLFHADKALGRKNSLWKLIQRIPLLLEEIDKPIIAAINGDAIGAGLDMALMCDYRIASKNARFCEGYIKLGVVPGDGGAYYLPRIVGVSKALEMLWLGDMIHAEEAERIGLINRVVEPESLIEETMRFAERLANSPAIAIRMIKRAVYSGLRTDLRTSLDFISSQMAIVTETQDFQEGVNALLEKRKPKFQGR